jgi:exopolyphosphatase / guanosine-5'-triphosphate,3'-diphosphate pyrophosphatase
MVAVRTVRTRAVLMTRRVAAVDCGTNSLRLLVADVDLVRAELTDVARRMEIVRLGQGVDQTGQLASAALARTAGVLRDYTDVIAATAASFVRMVATSATRDASNTVEFSRQVKEILGVTPEVLTGSEEALLSFTGATAELATTDDSGPYLVVDIGGGSTEFVLGDLMPRGDDPPQAISVNIGCVRMTERHLHGDPPAGAELAAATTDIDAALDTVTGALPVRQARTLIGLAGSVTTVAGIAMGLSAYDAARIHHAHVSAADVHEVTLGLLAQTRATRAAIGVMHPGRVDVIGGGALILDRIMQRFGFSEVLVSEHDILDGIAWSLAREPEGHGAVWTPPAPPNPPQERGTSDEGRQRSEGGKGRWAGPRRRTADTAADARP